MRLLRGALVLTLSFVLVAPAAAQQKSIVSQDLLDRALADRARQIQADREAVLHFLRQPEVQQVADRIGLDRTRAEHAVAALDATELGRVAAQARQAEEGLAGGASNLVISTTTLIIILLVLILLIVALK